MSERQITILTPEQEALIPVYQEKWQAIALSTEPINRQRAEAAIKAAYTIMGKRAPQIRFCSSPYEASLLKLESEENPVSQMLTNLGDMLLSQVEEFWRLIETLQPSPNLPDNIDFTGMFFAQIKEMGKAIEGHKKNQDNPLINLKLELENSALDRLKTIVNSHLPQDIKLAEIVEYVLQTSRELGNGINSQNGNASTTFADVVGGPEAVRGMVSQFEQMWWFAKPLFQLWIEGMLAGTVYWKAISLNWMSLENQLTSELTKQVEEMHSPRRYPCFQPMLGAVASIWIDFCFSVLHLPGDVRKWEAFSSVVQECGWIFCTDEICVVCDRPQILSLDSENRLHSEAEPAIQFTDSYSVYAHHGVILPEKYGRVNPHEWQAEWLLEENNIELRRVLVEGIGYAGICQDLHAVELDSFAEYTLLRIDTNIDAKSIYLLKITDPSTEDIRVKLVPFPVRSAREAIKWVNWGVDPEEFSSQR